METSEWQTVPPANNIPGFSVYTGAIDKPELDSREYRILRLESGLHAVLVHDATADKAAACVSIAVGHLQDPVSRLYVAIDFCWC